jgi:outer membrane receptor for ferrienterochelin and colicin
MRFQAINPLFRNLNDLKAVHYVLGLEYVDAGTKITLEGYYKKYEDMLIDTNVPYALASELAIEKYYYPYYLTNEGKGYARGIEFVVHKKLVEHFYGSFNASVYRSRYKDLDGIWRRSSYENRYIINLIAGYKPNPKWEFGLSWIINGGKPRRPFDLEASRLNNQVIYDMDMSKYNTHNFPVYSRANLRIERKFYFEKTNLILFFSIWNIFNTTNSEEFDWDPVAENVIEDGQMPLMPVFGIKLDF